MSDTEILDKCRELGVDGGRLRRVLAEKDNWGGMVNAFEYLAVLGAVAEAFAKEEAE